MALVEQYNQLTRSLARVEALRDASLKALSESQTQVAVLEAEEETLSRVADLFRVLIDREVMDNAKTVESLLTEGLQAIFDDLDLSVRTEIEVQRGKVAVAEREAVI